MISYDDLINIRRALVYRVKELKIRASTKDILLILKGVVTGR